MNTCPHCAAQSWRQRSETPLSIIEFCEACGHERTILISPLEDPVFEGIREPVFPVQVRWPRPPSSDAVAELLAHFWLMPETEETVRRKAGNGGKIKLGTFNDSEMRTHAPVLEKLGLIVERIDTPSER